MSHAKALTLMRAALDRLDPGVLAASTVWSMPEPWEASLVGIRRVLRRLLAHAGLDSLTLELEYQPRVWHTERDTDGPMPGVIGLELSPRTRTWAEGALVSFVRAEPGKVVFSADEPGAEVPSHVAALAALEVARARLAIDAARPSTPYRRDALPAEAPGAELVEAAAVALGFGVLLLCESRVFASHNDQRAQVRRDRAATQQTPPEITALLALRLAAWDEDRVDGEPLNGDQRQELARARSGLDDERPRLLAALGLTDVSWPAPREVTTTPFVEPIEERALSQLVRQQQLEEADAGKRRHAGIKTFRVPNDPSQGGRVGLLVLVTLVGGGLLVGKGLAPAWLLLALVVLGFVAGMLWSRRSRRDFCSEPDCVRELAPGLELCPGCGGSISGTIKRASERLAAREDEPAVG